jgi:phosphocarrier protein
MLWRFGQRPTLKEASRTVVISNRLGMHARAAGKFRNLAAQYKSQIKVIRGKMEADAKSILGLMALGACQGTELLLKATGEDAEDALQALAELVDNRFGEEE